MTDQELVDHINRARRKAATVGSMSAMWDVIIDAEAILYGKPTIMSRPEVEKSLTDFVK
jgi:hypothetical protein